MRTSLSRFCPAVAGACLGALLFGLRGDTRSLKPAADTSLFEVSPNNNLGKAWLAAGTQRSGERARALVRFDLAAVPTNAVVSSAAVTFKVVKAAAGAVASTFELRRVLVDWTEGAKGSVGSGTGSAAAAGESSWNSRGLENWSAPGGAAGSDFAASTSATQPLASASLAFASTPGLVADVQAWLSDPAQNHGWVLLSQAETTPLTARRFGSRETSGSEPTLVLAFSVPPTPAPPQLVEPTRAGDQLQFQFAAEAGQAYTVEFAPALPATTWQVLTNFAAADALQTNTVQDNLTEPQRFYRVRSP